MQFWHQLCLLNSAFNHINIHIWIKWNITHLCDIEQTDCGSAVITLECGTSKICFCHNMEKYLNSDSHPYTLSVPLGSSCP